MIELSTAQLYMLKSLFSGGWPEDLAPHYVPARAGGTLQEWEALLGAGLVEHRDKRYYVTKEGRRQFELQRKGKWV